MAKKKKTLKQLDFQKKKLKVGAGKAKPSNVTNTSFSTRRISIKSQNLNAQGHSDLTKRLHLLRHHNDNVRRDTLAGFQKQMARICNTEIMTPLIRQTIPLICDESHSVREAAVDLFTEVGIQDQQILQLHCRVIALYVHMAMTHIGRGVQSDSTLVLRCLLRFCEEEVCRQQWVKLMDSLMTLLGWSGSIGKNAAAGVMQTKKRDARTQYRHLEALHDLVKAGCLEPEPHMVNRDDVSTDKLRHYIKYMLPSWPQPYEHLGLFSKALSNTNSTQNTTSASSLDMQSRRTLLFEKYAQAITKHSDSLIKDGGELGKIGRALQQLLLKIHESVV